MKIVSYVHASRCTLPCGGVGRHANNMILNLSQRPGVDCSVLFASSAKASKDRNDENFPLRALSNQRVPLDELLFERVLRVARYPKLDRVVGGDIDWVYSPMETMLPTQKARSAMTLHDVAAFETDLPWSNSPANKRARFTNALWLQRAFNRLDLIVTVSEFSKRRIIEVFDVAPEKIAVVGNGVGEEFFRVGGDRIGTVQKTNEVIVVGGLRYKKGADQIFAVADALKARKSDLKIVAIGQNEKKYEDRAAAYSNIETLGMVSDHEMMLRMSRAQALLMLSLYEGFGIPPLEAMACGTVSIVSNLASLPEVVGQHGFVVSPYESASIAELLDEVSINSGSYSDLIAGARTHAREFTWDKCVDRLMDAFSR